MLTRLKINGFKNLHAVDIRFGFFTCIAGANGVGKSNLFDAIKFLSDLASMPIANAANLVRGANAKSDSLASLFSFSPDGEARPMEFWVEALVPHTVIDDYSNKVSVASTLLQYELKLQLIRGDIKIAKGDRIALSFESLKPITSASPKAEWVFPGAEAALNLIKGQKRNYLIETIFDLKGVATKILLRGDRAREIDATQSHQLDDALGVSLKPRPRSGAPLGVPLTSPRTVLSNVDSDHHVAHLAMRREMQSWRLLQLEPTALREPDSFNSDSYISARGEHLPAALHRVQLSADVAADLSNLVSGITSVQVVDNDVLQLRTLEVKMNKQTFPASALSDGTLRFLALSIMACDPDAGGLVCMEEPENGIHPTKIPEIVSLVRRLSDSPDTWGESMEISDDLPLRQVIINTHSPLVVSEMRTDDLLFAKSWQSSANIQHGVNFVPCAPNWRSSLKNVEKETDTVSKGELLSFLAGASSREVDRIKGKRVKDVYQDSAQSPSLF